MQQNVAQELMMLIPCAGQHWACASPSLNPHDPVSKPHCGGICVCLPPTSLSNSHLILSPSSACLPYPRDPPHGAEQMSYDGG